MTSQSEPGNPSRRKAANDQDKSSKRPNLHPIFRKLAMDGNYHFEICRSQTFYRVMSSGIKADWFWRLLSPAGVTMMECGGYPDQQSCRAAVTLLQEKAGSASISFS